MNPADFGNWLADPHRRTLVMGVLNVTPDSFSDGGQHVGPAQSADAAERMLDDGAAVIDIGGESTRPGAQPVLADEQLRRVMPVIELLIKRRPATLISIDTTRAAVAKAALGAGALIVNDISAGRDDIAMLPTAAACESAAIVLMHMLGTPATMQQSPAYTDVVAEVGKFLAERAATAIAAGVDASRVLVDPGIGFGKTASHNLTLLREQPAVAKLAGPWPIVVGASRKRFIGDITGEPAASQRQFGTAAAVAWCVAAGAAIVRVHDVRQMAQVVAMTEAIRGVNRPAAGDAAR